MRLEAHFSYIDGQKLKFTYNDHVDGRSKVHDKIVDNCPDNMTHKPYSGTSFTVHLSSQFKEIPHDIQDKVGLDCILHVNIKTNIFTSKYKANIGEAVISTKLVLIDITPHKKYDV